MVLEDLRPKFDFPRWGREPLGLALRVDFGVFRVPASQGNTYTGGLSAQLLQRNPAATELIAIGCPHRPIPELLAQSEPFCETENEICIRLSFSRWRYNGLA